MSFPSGVCQALAAAVPAYTPVPNDGPSWNPSSAPGELEEAFEKECEQFLRFYQNRDQCGKALTEQSLRLTASMCKLALHMAKQRQHQWNGSCCNPASAPAVDALDGAFEKKCQQFLSCYESQQKCGQPNFIESIKHSFELNASWCNLMLSKEEQRQMPKVLYSSSCKSQATSATKKTRASKGSGDTIRSDRY